MPGRWLHAFRRNEDVVVGSQQFRCGPDGVLTPEPSNEDTVRRLKASPNYVFVPDQIGEPEKKPDEQPPIAAEPQKPRPAFGGLRGRRPGVRTDDEPAAE